MHVPWISPLRPEARVGHYVAHTPELAWAFSFLRAFPRASVSLVGSTVRDALLGKVPHSGHVHISHISPVRARAWMHATPAPSHLRVALHARPVSDFLSKQVFTADALAYDIGRGILSDPFQGISSLRQGLLTTLSNPDTHFASSPEDALAALRLSAQLRLSPSPLVWRAIVHRLPRVNHITTSEDGFATYLTPRQNLVREGLLALKHGEYGWNLLSRARAIPFSFPHLAQTEDYDRASSHFLSVHDTAVRTRYGNVPLSDNLLSATLYSYHPDRVRHHHFHSYHMAHNDVRHPRLAFSQQETSQILHKTHALLTENPSLWSLSRTEKMLLGPQGSEALSLAHLATLHDSSLRDQSAHIARAALTKDHLVRDILPAPLVRGRDLLPLGLSSGHHIRAYLNLIRDEQLKGGISTKEDALRYAQSLLLQSASPLFD